MRESCCVIANMEYKPQHRRRSSGVERTLGKGEAVSSILTGGTISPEDTLETRFGNFSEFQTAETLLKILVLGSVLQWLRATGWKHLAFTVRETVRDCFFYAATHRAIAPMATPLYSPRKDMQSFASGV